MADSICRFQPFLVIFELPHLKYNLGQKYTFLRTAGIRSANKVVRQVKNLQFSRNHGGERYVKSFDGFTHLLTMLNAVIMRFDSLREIETSMTAEVRKLHHIGIGTIPKRSALSDANSRRSEKFFEDVYHDLYETNKSNFTSDSRRNGTEEWVRRQRIIDSTTNSLFSNLVFISKDRQEERWHQGSYCHTCQRRHPLRLAVYFCSHK